MDQEKPRTKPLILATKGLPCTGKSTVAVALAEHLRCPLIDFEDIRVTTARAKEYLQNHPASYGILEQPLDDALCLIASRQFSLSHFKTVVIDSAIVFSELLDQLKKVASSCSARLCIVDCLPKDMSEWQRQLEEQLRVLNDNNSKGTKWYKDLTLEQLQSMFHDWYDGDVLWSESYAGPQDQDNVPRIVIHTTFPVKTEDYVEEVIQFVNSEKTEPGTKEAGGHTVGESEFRRQIETDGDCKNLLEVHPHPFIFSDEPSAEATTSEGGGEGYKCSLCTYCKGFILCPNASNYRCTKCICILHKSCAESLLRIQVPLHNHILTLTRSTFFCFCKVCHYPHWVGFPLYECKSCDFVTHPRCGLIPPTLEHQFHKHTLHFTTDTTKGRACHICSMDFLNSAFYTCSDCDFSLHPWCALLPMKAKHDRHLHTLTLDLAPLDGTDEYYCNACETLRNPNQCVYYCSECEFAAHITCLIPLEFSSHHLTAPWNYEDYPESES